MPFTFPASAWHFNHPILQYSMWEFEGLVQWPSLVPRLSTHISTANSGKPGNEATSGPQINSYWLVEIIRS